MFACTQKAATSRRRLADSLGLSRAALSARCARCERRSRRLVAALSARSAERLVRPETDSTREMGDFLKMDHKKHRTVKILWNTLDDFDFAEDLP